MVSLSVKIGKLRLKNPIMVASGTFGPEYKELVDIDSVGAIVMKTITLKSRIGNPPPRIAETASGMLNSIGLENKGLDDFINNKIPVLNKIKAPIIASIAGDDESEFKELASRLNKIKKIGAIELNLSCPNIKYGDRGNLIAQHAKSTFDIVCAVRKVTNLTLIAKLSPNVTDITEIAASAERAGADALLIANTFLGMAVDPNTRRPALGNVTGGLSGPAIKPLVLRMVWDAYKKVKVPIIGCGGIISYKDAIEFILCGASAVQVGTVNFVDPSAAIKIIKGLRGYLVENKIKDVKKITGAIEL